MPNYLSLRDMIDGGGAGRSGPTFEGGGLLSMLANAIATPLGSRERAAQARTGAPMPLPPGMQPMRPRARPAPPAGSGMTPANAYVPLPPLQGPPMGGQPRLVQPTPAPQGKPIERVVGTDMFSDEAFLEQAINLLGQGTVRNLISSGDITGWYEQWTRNGGRF